MSLMGFNLARRRLAAQKAAEDTLEKQREIAGNVPVSDPDVNLTREAQEASPVDSGLSYADETVTELRKLAKVAGITGASRMSKSAIVEALEAAS